MTVARHIKTNEVLKPQPPPGERDRYGHFRGCNWLSCEATRCRELLGDTTERDFYWSER